MRRKYADYYYTTKLEETASRNNSTPVKYYSWTIQNKEGEILEFSDHLIEGKVQAEIEAEEHIQEHYN